MSKMGTKSWEMEGISLGEGESIGIVACLS